MRQFVPSSWAPGTLADHTSALLDPTSAGPLIPPHADLGFSFSQNRLAATVAGPEMAFGAVGIDRCPQGQGIIG